MRIATLAGAPGDLIERADHFYIASHHSGDTDDARHGVDVSHRGGRAGFVRVHDDTVIEFPDFAGNHFFNTLGNIEASGRAGLLFIDVRDGSLLACSGRATIDWCAARAARLPGAERIVRIEVEHAWQHARALPWQWRLVESSPALDNTGVWPRRG
jgi:predicted pyridoxine 5'-phosphate oxidase superfamily flavin-nucleotide-binding protein